MRALIALLLAAATALPAFAAEPRDLQVFRGVPTHKGQWRMEILELQGPEGRGGAAAGQAMTLCTDNVLKASRERGREGRRESECKIKVLKDTASEAVVETQCPDGSGRFTMTREGDKRFLMQAENQGARGASRMKMRYAYLGACSEGQGMMSLDKDSPACQQMRAQAAKMDPAAQCANAGAQRAQCEARMRAAVEQMSAMCR